MDTRCTKSPRLDGIMGIGCKNPPLVQKFGADMASMKPMSWQDNNIARTSTLNRIGSSMMAPSLEISSKSVALRERRRDKEVRIGGPLLNALFALETQPTGYRILLQQSAGGVNDAE